MDSSSQSSGVLSLVPVDPSHPLLAGVDDFSGGSSSYHAEAARPAPSASLVAEWSDGDALVAVHVPSGAGSVVALNFYPPSSDARADFWDASTDGAALLANALWFVGE
jgi:hypothetical protein